MARVWRQGEETAEREEAGLAAGLAFRNKGVVVEQGERDGEREKEREGERGRERETERDRETDRERERVNRS